MAQEVAPFGIGVTIVEPGGARTEFRYGSAQVATLMPEYDATPAHAFLKMLDPKNGLAPGDPCAWPHASSRVQQSSPRRCAWCWAHRLWTTRSQRRADDWQGSRPKLRWLRRRTSGKANDRRPGLRPPRATSTEMRLVKAWER